MNGIHHHPAGETAPTTEGRTIRWAQHYDLVVRLLAFGRERALRNETIRQAAISTGSAVLDAERAHSPCWRKHKRAIWVKSTGLMLRLR